MTNVAYCRYSDERVDQWHNRVQGFKYIHLYNMVAHKQNIMTVQLYTIYVYSHVTLAL